MEFLSCVADYAKENGKRMVVYTADQIKRFRNFKTIGKILSRRFRFKIKHRNLYNAIINTPIHGKDLRLLYNKTRICLNINQEAKNPEWHTGVNPRTFEIMGCNSFELIDELSPTFHHIVKN